MKDRFGSEIPKWLRMLGATRIVSNSIEFTWGWIATGWGFELLLNRGGYFDQRWSISFSLIWGKATIYLPFKTKIPESCSTPKYGIQIHNKTLWIHLGGKMDEGWNQCDSKWITWDLPFISWIFDLHEVQLPDGSWVEADGYFDRETGTAPDGRYVETHPYTYVLNSGKIQNRQASIYKERRTWHHKWLPFLKRTRTNIDISFDGEVGERTGSWKGGTVGCSWDIEPGETMVDCLRRMEKERRFR